MRLHPLLAPYAPLGRAGLGDTVVVVPQASPPAPKRIWPWVLGIGAAAAGAFYWASRLPDETKGDRYLAEYEARARRAR